ncbi:MAG: DUF2029 domain-containing protein [Candidatus Melainabacteria bacterium]|jgi:hypothetical protein|nr:DUF2029 domain-containing protein [Candidatus Melainabacteria bacterium]
MTSAPEESSQKKMPPTGLLYKRIFAIFLFVVPLTAALSQPKLMQASDFLMTFYLAGKLTAQGKFAQLYPPVSAQDLFNTPFNQFAHQTLDALGQGFTAIYMYSPLNALLMVPFAFFDTRYALFAWQIFSIICLALSAFLIKSATGRSAAMYFFASVYFLPVFATLLIGHLGIVLGILPLALAYYAAQKQRPFLAGLCYSLFILKPQFLPIAMLASGADCLKGRYKSLVGLIAGLLALVALTIGVFGIDIIKAWLSSFRLSDTIFSDPRYNYPHYLVSSLPGVVVQAVPVEMRQTAKLITYGLGGLFGLHALYKALQYQNRFKEQALPAVIMLGCSVLPLVLPHFLFYDLCIMTIAGMLIFGHHFQNTDLNLRMHAIAVLLFTSLYTTLYLFGSVGNFGPIILVAILTLAHCRLLYFLDKTEAIKPFTAK